MIWARHMREARVQAGLSMKTSDKLAKNGLPFRHEQSSTSSSPLRESESRFAFELVSSASKLSKFDTELIDKSSSEQVP